MPCQCFQDSLTRSTHSPVPDIYPNVEMLSVWAFKTHLREGCLLVILWHRRPPLSVRLSCPRRPNIPRWEEINRRERFLFQTLWDLWEGDKTAKAVAFGIRRKSQASSNSFYRPRWTRNLQNLPYITPVCVANIHWQKNGDSERTSWLVRLASALLTILQSASGLLQSAMFAHTTNTARVQNF